MAREILDALVSRGVKLNVHQRDLRALWRIAGPKQEKEGPWVKAVPYLCSIPALIGSFWLNDRIPSVFTGTFFLGLCVGVFIILVALNVMIARLARRENIDKIGEYTIGVEDDLLWVYKNGMWWLFSEVQDFHCVVFDQQHIFAFLEKRRALIIARAPLNESEAGRMVHAWLARAR